MLLRTDESPYNVNDEILSIAASMTTDRESREGEESLKIILPLGDSASGEYYE